MENKLNKIKETTAHTSQCVGFRNKKLITISRKQTMSISPQDTACVWLWLLPALNLSTLWNHSCLTSQISSLDSKIIFSSIQWKSSKSQHYPHTQKHKSMQPRCTKYHRSWCYHPSTVTHLQLSSKLWPGREQSYKISTNQFLCQLHPMCRWQGTFGSARLVWSPL